MTHNSKRVGIVGLGNHGTAIASILLAKGYSLVGVVDIGEKVGRPISDYLESAEGVVSGSVENLLDGPRPDVVVMTASADVPTTVADAAVLMEAGVNVVTIHEGLLVPDEELTGSLNAIGERTGATFVSTGAQDTWWIHLPALLAGTTTRLDTVTVTWNVDVNDLPAAVGRQLGVGLTAEAFAKTLAAPMKQAPSVLTQPLEQAAKRIGVLPGVTVNSTAPVIADVPVAWGPGGITVQVGDVVGIRQTTRFSAGDVAFVGVMTTCLLDGLSYRAVDSIEIEGEPSFKTIIAPFPGLAFINAAVVNRVADVLNAPGGVLSATDLQPAKFDVGSYGNVASLG